MTVYKRIFVNQISSPFYRGPLNKVVRQCVATASSFFILFTEGFALLIQKKQEIYFICTY